MSKAVLPILMPTHGMGLIPNLQAGQELTSCLSQSLSFPCAGSMQILRDVRGQTWFTLMTSGRAATVYLTQDMLCMYVHVYVFVCVHINVCEDVRVNVCMCMSGKQTWVSFLRFCPPFYFFFVDFIEVNIFLCSSPFISFMRKIFMT